MEALHEVYRDVHVTVYYIDNIICLNTMHYVIFKLTELRAIYPAFVLPNGFFSLMNRDWNLIICCYVISIEFTLQQIRMQQIFGH